jgi:hypothetical protein
MYSLAGVAAANTVVPLKLVLPTVNNLTMVEVPVLLTPVVVRVVPSKVRFAELVWRPPVPLYTTRPEVRLVLVIDELETPVRPVRAVTHWGAVPDEVMTLSAAPMPRKVVVEAPD